MKKEFYFSWCPGLSTNQNALELIKKSEAKGIELCEASNEANTFKNEKIKINIHNPLRHLRMGLENKELIKELNPHSIKLLKENEEPFLGFHLCYSPDINFLDKSIIFEQIKNNINFLRKNTNKKIIFESPPYGKKHHEKVTSAEFVKEMLNYTDGYLFDIAHNFVTIKNSKDKKYKQKLLEFTKGKVLQIHLNSPSYDNKFYDGHNLFTGKEYEKEIIELTNEVIKLNPQLKIITLEINTNSNPEEHVKKLSEQYNYLKNKLI